MKKTGILTISALAVAGLAGALTTSVADAQEKPRVAVMALDNNTSWWGHRLGGAAADVLTTRLVNEGSFSVIERQRLAEIMEEQNLQMSGAVRQDQAMEIGKLLGAQYMIMGSITKFSIDRKSGGFGRISASFTQAESALNLRIINTETGEIVVAADGEGDKKMGGAAVKGARFSSSSPFNVGVAEEALEPAVSNVVEKIEDRRDALVAYEMEPAAQEAEVVGEGDGGSVYIDQGENRDVSAGDRYEVYRVVDEIVDSEGNVLDQVTEKVGVIEVERVLSQSSICNVVEGDAMQGDVAKPAGEG